MGLAACVSGSLVTYPNGAQVPFDGANLAATQAHLAYKGYGPYHAGLYHGGVHYIGKREAEADASLVTYSNGAVVPYNPYLHGFAGYGYHGVHYLGKREAEADASFYYAPLAYSYPLVHHVPLVAHPNGAVVPAEPLSVSI